MLSIKRRINRWLAGLAGNFDRVCNRPLKLRIIRLSFNDHAVFNQVCVMHNISQPLNDAKGQIELV